MFNQALGVTSFGHHLGGPGFGMTQAEFLAILEGAAALATAVLAWANNS